MDISVAGLEVTVQAAEVPPAASLLLAPQDWDVHVARNTAADTTAVLLRVGALAACASPAAAQALARLQAALMPPGDDQPAADAAAGAGTAPEAVAVQQRHLRQTDDLACGLFSLSPELAGRPGEMSALLMLNPHHNATEFEPMLSTCWSKSVHLLATCRCDADQPG